MTSSTDTCVRYTDSIETPKPDEEQTFTELAETMLKISQTMNDQYRHAVRSVHAKSHGLLKAELTVLPGLPTELAQGLFSKVSSYPAIIRLSTTPGDLLADSVSTPRGMAAKVLGIEGMPMFGSHAGNTTQDLICVNGKAFNVPDAKSFLGAQQLLLKTLNQPELLKKAVSNVARGTNAVLGLVGLHSETLNQLGAPETHILGETFGSLAAIRYGDYICKFMLRPVSENLKALTGKHVDVNFHFSGIRDAVVEFFKYDTAEWEVCVQLCKDLSTMPVEDPSIEWPEDVSPYVPVAKLVAKPQDAYSPKRRVYVDEILEFTPFHCLEAHRPLGQIMRARKLAYELSARFRHEMNDRPRGEPRTISELPD